MGLEKAKGCEKSLRLARLYPSTSTLPFGFPPATIKSFTLNKTRKSVEVPTQSGALTCGVLSSCISLRHSSEFQLYNFWYSNINTKSTDLYKLTLLLYVSTRLSYQTTVLEEQKCALTIRSAHETRKVESKFTLRPPTFSSRVGGLTKKNGRRSCLRFCSLS